MRIVIDLQAAQSPHSRNRGIGRYSIALAKGMLRHGSDHEILIALNGMYDSTVLDVREEFAPLLPPHRIVTWHGTLPAMELPGASPEHRRAAELVREAFLASLKPDVVHVASLFESGPYSVTSVGLGTGTHRTAVTLYDLIPHVYPEIYLDRPKAARDYGEKIDHLRRADLWLAISESSRREGIERLGLPAQQVVNISSAADTHFTAGAVPAEHEAALRHRYGLWRPFVMYTGGIDHRKNIEGLIEAWAALPADLRLSHQLAVVCSVQPAERARLEQLAERNGLAFGDLVLTGFVPEDNLVDLYRLCKLFVFPSLHEGFGLPALEAMCCGAPVIGADNSSIPEVIGRADALFQARSQASMTAKIREYLVDDGLRDALAAHGLQQAQQFNWDKSAQAAMAAIEQLAPVKPPALRAVSPEPATRPRLAFVSPMPPQRSGIADYSAELLPALARHYEIDLVLEQPALEPLPAGCYGQQRTAEWFLAHGHEYDRVLYQFGNSAFHEYMFPLLERHPGTVVLHDFYLSGVQAHRELVTAGQPYWSRALYESHGWHALARRCAATDLTAAIHQFPASFDVLRQAEGVIVHSPYSKVLAYEWYGPEIADDWATIPLLRVAAPLEREAARAALGLAPDDFLVCAFGLMGPTKMNHRLLAAWTKSALAREANCRLVFVGENHPADYGREMQREIASFNDAAKGNGKVAISGWASTEDFRRYLNAADLAVQLRTLSRGETSAAVLDAMNHALPVVVNANGSMAYLPGEAALILDDDFTDEQLTRALEGLWRDPARRRAMGQAGRRLIETQHSPADCAAAYAQAIESFAGRAAQEGPMALLRQLGQTLPADTGEPLLENLSRAIANNMPQLRPARQMLIDITAWVRHDPAAVSALPPLPDLFDALLERPGTGWRAEPVYQNEQGEWRYARNFMLQRLSCRAHLLAEDPIELQPTDLWWVPPGAEAWTALLPARALELGVVPLQLSDKAQAPLVWAWLAATEPVRRGRFCYVDISELVRHDWRSGIQRVVKNYLMEFLMRPPAGSTVMPVYATKDELGYRLALGYLCELAGLDAPEDGDPPLDAQAGDMFLGLDLQPHIVPLQAPFLNPLQQSGVGMAFMVYDLLPLRLPDCFSPGAAEHHERWLQHIARAELLICISQAVADDLSLWLQQRPPAESSADAPHRMPRIRAVHPGANLAHTLPTRGLPPDAAELLAQIRQRPAFLMVGTLEPRKAHAAVLAAFEQLWAGGEDVGLVIVGRPGWMVDELLSSLGTHPERGHRLVWVEDSSDEFLEQVYAASACLVAASLGEGFGLPIVEAAKHGLPIIARDLPVFREVAGEHAWYFADDAPEALAANFSQWLSRFREGRHPAPQGMRWHSWRASADKVKQLLVEQDWDGRPAAR